MKVEVSHHTQKDGKFSNVKPLVFIMDDVKTQTQDKDIKQEGKKPKKQKKSAKNTGPAVTIKNFGSKASVTVVKASKNLSIAWRCRPHTVSVRNLIPKMSST